MNTGRTNSARGRARETGHAPCVRPRADSKGDAHDERDGRKPCERDPLAESYHFGTPSLPLSVPLAGSIVCGSTDRILSGIAFSKSWMRSRTFLLSRRPERESDKTVGNLWKDPLTPRAGARECRSDTIPKRITLARLAAVPLIVGVTFAVGSRGQMRVAGLLRSTWACSSCPCSSRASRSLTGWSSTRWSASSSV